MRYFDRTLLSVHNHQTALPGSRKPGKEGTDAILYRNYCEGSYLFFFFVKEEFCYKMLNYGLCMYDF